MVASLQTRATTSENDIFDVVPAIQQPEAARIDWRPLYNWLLQIINPQLKIVIVAAVLIIGGVFSACSMFYINSNASFWNAALISLPCLVSCGFSKLPYMRRYLKTSVESAVVVSFAAVIGWSQTLVCDVTQPTCEYHAMIFHLILFVMLLVVAFQTLGDLEALVIEITWMVLIQTAIFAWYLESYTEMSRRVWCEQTLFALVISGIAMYSLYCVKNALIRRRMAPRIYWMLPAIAAYNAYLYAFRLLHWKLFMEHYIATQP